MLRLSVARRCFATAAKSALEKPAALEKAAVEKFAVEASSTATSSPSPTVSSPEPGKPRSPFFFVGRDGSFPADAERHIASVSGATLRAGPVHPSVRLRPPLPALR